jgi:DedD protein
LAHDGDGPVVDEPQSIDQPGGVVSAEVEEMVLPTAPVATGQAEDSSFAPSRESEVRSEAPQPLTMDASGVPVAWSLQVATVSSAEKAESLRKRLLELNYKAYTSRVSSGGKSLYRISIGPKFERLELEKLQARINAEFGVTTMVVRYTP